MDLVAGYSSSSDEEPQEKPKTILPSASEVLSNLNDASVLESQYDRNKKLEDSVLEQHVKMVESQKVDQAKKICWMFKKGKCKYGDKCKNRHDRLSANLMEMRKSQNPAETRIDDDTQQQVKAKKRYGVSDSLTPPKKALKQLQSLK